MKNHVTGEEKLQAAMERLLNGEPTFTDGALTKTNLYTEAQVSRATMNRHCEILQRWGEALAARNAPSIDVKAVQRAHKALESRHRETGLALTKVQGMLRQTQSDLRASATVIAALYSENLLLNEQLDSVRRRALAILPNP